MLRIVRSNSENNDFIQLVSELDNYLAIRNGKDNDFFSQYNQLDAIQYVIIAFEKEIPVGCGAIKEYSDNSMEVKRMFVLNDYRGKGIASLVLNELEKWAKELGYEKCILETGRDMVDAVRLYKKSNYRVISNYGQYENIKSSICFQKILR